MLLAPPAVPLLLVALNKLFHRFVPGVSGFKCPPGESPRGGKRLPPGVNNGGVIPGNFALAPGGFKLDKFGICKLCLLLFAD